MAEASFGKYRLIAELGHGGMADVFLAVQAGPAGSGFRKLTVIKRLRQNLVDEPEFVAMLVDEARIAANLNHPNVVQTNEVGREGEQYFIAMEYLDGQPLHRIQHRAMQRTKESGQPVLTRDQQCIVLMDCLSGLHHAHELADFDGTPLQIVHRDMTPHNIFVTYEGQVKVVDFGIAKAVGRASETRQGIVKGKVRYMSPEQALGQNVDRRADVFSVGVMLWEVVAGRRLWKDLDDFQIVQALVGGTPIPSPREVDPQVPEELVAICSKALALSRDDRYVSAEDFRADLELFLGKAGVLVEARRGLVKTIGELFKEKRQEIRRVIEKQLADLDLRATTSSSNAVSPVLMQSDSTPLSLSLVDQANAFSLNRSREVQLTQPLHVGSVIPNDSSASHQPVAVVPEVRPKSKGPLVGGLLLAMVLVTGGTFGVWRYVKHPGGMTTDPTASPSVPSASSSSAEDPTKEFTNLVVEASPASAKVYIDDVPLGSNPGHARYVRDDIKHHVRAEAPGYKRKMEVVTFDAAERKVTITLEPEGGGHGVGINIRPTTAPPTTRPTAHEPATSNPTATTPPTSTTNTASTTTTPPTPTTAPTPTTPPTNTAPAVAPGTVDTKAVRAVVRQHQGEVQGCYDRARMDKPNLKGRVTVSAVVSPQGVPKSVSASSGTGSSRLEQCLKGAFGTWKFPEPAGGVDGNVSFTFNFE